MERITGLVQVWFEQSPKVHPVFIRSCEIKISQHWFSASFLVEMFESRVIPSVQLLFLMTKYGPTHRGHWAAGR